jgi:hypothetical protein
VGFWLHVTAQKIFRPSENGAFAPLGSRDYTMFHGQLLLTVAEHSEYVVADVHLTLSLRVLTVRNTAPSLALHRSGLWTLQRLWQRGEREGYCWAFRPERSIGG